MLSNYQLCNFIFFSFQVSDYYAFFIYLVELSLMDIYKLHIFHVSNLRYYILFLVQPTFWSSWLFELSIIWLIEFCEPSRA